MLVGAGDVGDGVVKEKSSSSSEKKESRALLSFVSVLNGDEVTTSGG